MKFATLRVGYDDDGQTQQHNFAHLLDTTQYVSRIAAKFTAYRPAHPCHDG